MGPDGPREELLAKLKELGCEIRETARGGQCVDCPSHEAKVKLLDALAWIDCRYDPRVRQCAVSVAQGAATDRRHRVDNLDLAKRLHAYVCEHVRYLGEGAETFQSTSQTLLSGVGDCDDGSRALLALARSVAIPARLVVYDKTQGPDLAPSHATVQLSPDGKTWYYAETSLGPACQFGEEPLAAAKRLKAGRSDITGQLGDLGGVGGDVVARSIIQQAWQAVKGRAPTTFEAQVSQGIAKLETGYGTWDGAGATSHNWGAIQCPAGTTAESANCFPNDDTNQDGSRYATFFKSYPDDVAGATDLIRELTTRRPLTAAALAAGKSVYDVSQALYRERYYGAACPIALAADPTAAKHSSWSNPQHQPTSAAGSACDAEAIRQHADTLYRLAAQIAVANGELPPAYGAPMSRGLKVFLGAAGLVAALGIAQHQGYL